jgi:hypothetical protein
MKLLFAGQMDPDTILSDNYCVVSFDAGESIESIKRRMIDKLAKIGEEWAATLLDSVEGTGPFNSEPGKFLLSWTEQGDDSCLNAAAVIPGSQI